MKLHQHRNAIAKLVDEAAARVKRNLGTAKTVGENRHLKKSVRAAAESFGGPAGRPRVATELKVAQPDWPFGPADFALTWPGAAPVLIETKSGSGTDAAGELVWDSAKLALLLQRGIASGGFLLACARVEDWARPVRGVEFVGDHNHEASIQRILNADWWRRWEKDPKVPDPTVMPRAWRTEFVHAARIDVADTPWELRLSEVKVVDNQRIQWPPLSAPPS